MRRCIVVFLSLLFLFSCVAKAQKSGSSYPDSVFHSPTKATLFSTFVPGLGQIYNKQVWKTPIIYVGLGALVYLAVDNYNNMEKFKTEYYNRLNGTGSLLPDYTTYSNGSIYSLYNAYKDNFHLCVILSSVLYLAQILDAYVYGHLFSFDISDDITLNLTPSLLPNTLSDINTSFGLNLSLRF